MLVNLKRIETIKQMLLRSASTLIGALVLFNFSSTTVAHERFMVPTHTVLSGDDKQYVSVISSISNDLFHPDRPFGDNGKGVQFPSLKPLFDILESTVTLPSGKVNSDIQWQAFQRFSAADVPLKSSGTYRISLRQGDVHMITYEDAKGNYGRVFGKNVQVPDGVSNIVRRTTESRVETFVSLNEPNNTALSPTSIGVSLSGPSHPNDLFAGEKATFTVNFMGSPVSEGVKIKLIKAGTRHRNERGEKELTLSENGTFSFTPESAGFYFLGVTTEVKVKQPADTDVKHYSLYATLEVFPQ